MPLTAACGGYEPSLVLSLRQQPQALLHQRLQYIAMSTMSICNKTLQRVNAIYTQSDEALINYDLLVKQDLQIAHA